MKVFQLFIYLAIIWIVTFLVIGYAHGEPILHGFYYGNGSLYHVEFKACFANKTLLDKFLENDSQTIFKLTVPCPELPKEYTQHEDESGK